MGGNAERIGMKPGDRLCPKCGDLVFASKAACKMCHTARPDDSAIHIPGAQTRFGMKLGDWTCPNCGDMVFGSRDKCKMCHTRKPMPLTSYQTDAGGVPTGNPSLPQTTPSGLDRSIPY